MKVAIFNVGGALSSYIELGEKKIIIDLGMGNDFSPVNEFLLPLFNKRNNQKSKGKYIIDQLIISHPLNTNSF